MSHKTYQVHPDARRDLKGIIGRMVVDRGSTTAAKFVEAARETLIRIGDAPALGSPVESRNVRLTGLRKRAVPRFGHVLAFYQEAEGRVSILRVLYASQDWSTLLNAD